MYWKERLAPSLARLEKAAQKGLARDDVACSRVESPLKLEELGELTKQLVLVCNSPQLDIPVTPQNRKEPDDTYDTPSPGIRYRRNAYSGGDDA
jgi:hypothetical protein